MTDVTGRKTIRELALDQAAYMDLVKFYRPKKQTILQRRISNVNTNTGYFCFDERKRKQTHTRKHTRFSNRAHMNGQQKHLR